MRFGWPGTAASLAVALKDDARAAGEESGALRAVWSDGGMAVLVLEAPELRCLRHGGRSSVMALVALRHHQFRRGAGDDPPGAHL